MKLENFEQLCIWVPRTEVGNFNKFVGILSFTGHGQFFFFFVLSENQILLHSIVRSRYNESHILPNTDKT